MAARDPPKWSEEQLEAARVTAASRFVLERKGEGPDAFRQMCDVTEPLVREAMASTDDLREISERAFAEQPGLWQILRYFCAPPISEEDLWTLVGRKFRSVSRDLAAPTAAALASVLDAWRLPWVGEQRAPSAAERESAVMATTLLLAHERLKTARRGRSSRKQEEEVSEALLAAGLNRDVGRRSILRLDELPRGCFSRERKVNGAKCDIPVRLHDGRLLAIECKVSNGPKNSWKRLQREVGGKSERWRQEFGSQVVTGAVLAGVFDLRCLRNAQDEQNVALFWQHDLVPLTDFVAAAT